MKITKRILSVVMTVMMIMSLMICSYAAAFSDVEATHSNYTAITTLADMGIINGYTDGTFKPDNAVTRAEMAKLISVLYGYDVATVAKSPFTDVADDHWAVTFISTMKDVGIINGMGDGTFLPNNEVTYEQCLKMIVCALNWGEVAAQASTPDDWSLGYRQHATRLGITKYVSVESNSSPAPRGVVAQLLYNSLDAKRAEKVVDANGNVSFKGADDSVSDELSLYELKGARIISTPKYNIDGEFIKDGYIRLVNSAGKEYEMSVGSYSDLLDAAGRFVDIKYKVDADDNMTISSRTLLGTKETIDVKKVKDVADSYIEYYVDEDYERTKKITIDNPAVIYNNRVLKNAGDFDTLLKGDITSTASDSPLNYFGNIEIIEHASGDLITAKIYKSYYMSTAVDSKNFMVKFDTKDAQVYIPVSNRENYEIIRKTSLTKDGSTPSSISISTNSVVSICMSPDGKIYGTNYIEYIPITAKQKGSPTDITDSGSRGSTVVISGKTYLVANDAIKGDFIVNSTTGFMLDASGAIVYVTSKPSGNDKFVLLKSAKENDAGDVVANFCEVDNLSSDITVTFLNTTTENKEAVEELAKYKNELLWINPNSKNEIENKTQIKAAKEVADNYAEGTELIKKVASSKYTFENAKDKDGNSLSDYTISTSNTKVIKRPDMNTSSSVTYSSLTISEGTKYPNPKAYSIKKDNKTITYIVADPYVGLLDSSNVYVVMETPNTTSGVDENKHYPVKCYNFKTGAEVTNALKIKPNVVEALSLKKGDVFTYFDKKDNDFMDIDRLDSIYILLRPSMIFADKTSQAGLGTLSTYAEGENAKNFLNGFRKYGIYKSDVTYPANSYTLQMPVYVDSEDSRIYFARSRATFASGKLSAINTYVHGDDMPQAVKDAVGTEAWKTDLVSKFGDDILDTTVNSSTKVFIYDYNAKTDKAELTAYSSLTKNEAENKDDIADVLSSIITLQNVEAKSDNFNDSIANVSATFGYFNDSNSLKTLFIIK